jgi:hypothetical protein
VQEINARFAHGPIYPVSTPMSKSSSSPSRLCTIGYPRWALAHRPPEPLVALEPCTGSRLLVPSSPALRAAVGAESTSLVGFVTGLAKAGTGWSPEPATSRPCPPTRAESTTPAEGN